MVLPAQGKSFDPSRIPQAARKAGFDAPEVRLTVRGRIEQSGAQTLLRVPGLTKAIRLLGDDQLQAVRQKRDQWSQSVLIIGVLEIGEEAEGSAILLESHQFPE